MEERKRKRERESVCVCVVLWLVDKFSGFVDLLGIGCVEFNIHFEQSKQSEESEIRS